MPNVIVYVVTPWANLPIKSTPITAENLSHIEQGVKNVTDFVNTINAEAGLYLSAAPFTSELATKLNGIEEHANNYSLPTASTSTKGGVKVDGTTITIDANGVISAVGGTGGVTELSELDDVNLTQLTEGQILKWDATNSKWVNAAIPEVSTSLSALTDVTITSPQNGQVLKWDSTLNKWVNSNGGGGGASELSELDDVDLTNLDDGEVIVWDATNSKWVNSAITVDELTYNETLDILGRPVDPVESGEAYTRELVYDCGSTTAGAPFNVYVPFIKSIAEFDQLICIVAANGDGGIVNRLAATQVIIDLASLNDMGYYPIYGYRTLRIVEVQDTQFKYYGEDTQNRPPSIYKIYGVKFKGADSTGASATPPTYNETMDILEGE